MYDIVLLDMDGTVADTGLGITNAVMYSLNKLGIMETDRSKFYKFIGPPLVESYSEYYGLDEEKTNLAIEYYREYYREKGIFENNLYDGIKETIIELKNRGKKVLLATSKPEVFSLDILKQHDIYKYFDFCSCATLDGTRKQKVDIINYAFEQTGITDRDKALMVGDRKHDIIGAKKAGIKVAAVLFGFGNREEFEEYGADYIIERPEDLLEIV